MHKPIKRKCEVCLSAPYKCGCFDYNQGQDSVWAYLSEVASVEGLTNFLIFKQMEHHRRRLKGEDVGSLMEFLAKAVNEKICGRGGE